MGRNEALAKIDSYFHDGMFEAELARRVAYRTESVRPDSGPALAAYLEEDLIPYLTDIGFACETYPNPRADAGPILVARRQEGDNLPTVMTYGHGDVVPGFDGQWDNDVDPWVITKAGNRWYGRGTADNKGQHTINLAALKTVLETRGALGFNVILLIEMGEERGSPGLKEFCAANKQLFAADVFSASDGPRLHPDKPTMFMGSRGVFNFTMRLDVHAGGHHSGNWGGLLTNPGVVMAHAIASMIDRNGKILVEGWRNTHIPNSVRAAIAKLEVGGGENAPTMNPNWGEPDMTPAERVFASNTVEVRA
ncbi:MAG: M20/M25/M40 family metallo-hydrolase, partial [Candidatus Puniceispirillum sp.]